MQAIYKPPFHVKHQRALKKSFVAVEMLEDMFRNNNFDVEVTRQMTIRTFETLRWKWAIKFITDAEF